MFIFILLLILIFLFIFVILYYKLILLNIHYDLRVHLHSFFICNDINDKSH